MTTAGHVYVLGQLFVFGLGAQPADWSNTLAQARAIEAGGRYAEALTKFRAAASLADAFGTHDTRTWATYNYLAIAYHENADYTDSIRTYRRVIGMIKDAGATESSEYVMVLSNLGSAYLGLNQTVASENVLREALRIQSGLPRPDEVQLAVVRSRMAAALINRRPPGEVENMLQDALRVFRQAKEISELPIVLNNLAMVRRFQHRFSEAAELLQEAIAMIEEKLGPNHPLLLRSLNNLAVVYSMQGRMDEAREAFDRAETICLRMPAGHRAYPAILFNHAHLLRHTGEKKQAHELEAKARALSRDNDRRSGIGMTIDVSAFQQRK